MLDIMSSVTLFKELNVEHSSEILQMYQKRIFAPGEYVCKVGDSSDVFYIIQTGLAQVQLTSEKGKIVKPYYPGDYFGEQVSACIVSMRYKIL